MPIKPFGAARLFVAAGPGCDSARSAITEQPPEVPLIAGIDRGQNRVTRSGTPPAGQQKTLARRPTSNVDFRDGKARFSQQSTRWTDGHSSYRGDQRPVPSVRGVAHERRVARGQVVADAGFPRRALSRRGRRATTPGPVGFQKNGGAPPRICRSEVWETSCATAALHGFCFPFPRKGSRRGGGALCSCSPRTVGSVC